MDHNAQELKDGLAVLEAERLVATIELRNALIRAAQELLPEAIRQSKPQPHGGKRPAHNGNPASVHLISRLAMRPTQLETPK